MIEVKHLTKRYGNHDAIRDLNFKITSGKIYGLLGPNGAGKSTTMNIMTGCLSATEGTVRINGFDIYDDPIEAKRCIGYLPELPPLYTDMTPEEYLHFVARAKGAPGELLSREVAEVMELTQLTDMKDRLIRNLSKGYRQRVGIAQAMLGSPEIIILDEPTVGLDPLQLVEIRQLIRRLGEEKTVIISSHILDEIDEICDEFLIISGGRLVANGSREELEAMVGDADTLRLVVRGDREGILDVLSGIDGIDAITDTDNKDGTIKVELRVERGTDPRDTIFFAMAERRYAVITSEIEHMTLEKLFLTLTGDTLTGKSEEANDASDGEACEDEPTEDSAKDTEDADAQDSAETAKEEEDTQA